LTDPFKFTTIAHTDRFLLGPYSASAITELVPRVQERVLDVGCGKGGVLEVLGGKGIGIEHNPAFAQEARKRNPNADVWEEDARTSLDRLPWHPNLTVCLGAAQAVGTPEEALAKFATLMQTGSLLLFGDGYWRQKPPSGYLAFLGADESEMGALDQIPETARAHGFELVTTRPSTEEEWDDYERSYHRSMLAWCEANPNDPDAAAFQERIIRWRAAYLQWGRDTLGFGIHLLRKSN